MTPLFGYSQDTNKDYNVRNITVIGDSLYCTDSIGLMTLADMKLEYKKNTKALVALEDLYLISQIDVKEYHNMKKAIKSNQRKLNRKIKKDKRKSAFKGALIGACAAYLTTIIY